MLFTSTEFFVFFGLVLLLVWLAGQEKNKRRVLLAASYVFYGWWEWSYCLLILASTAVDYLAALRIQSRSSGNARRRWLILSLSMNLGLLAFFKYSGFFAETLGSLTGASNFGPLSVDVLLPVGISFFTFQSMSYTIDVYRGRLQATQDFGDFALYVSFFPQLVAGPIVRAADFLPQYLQDHSLRSENLRVGFQVFVRGFVKKVLFADTLAVMVDHVFSQPAAFSSATSWIAIVAYAGQIYYDFSGYTDMAIGAARMLGFELPVNFRHPYLSCSVTEFWRRWHISLSTWLRDYLYIPLGGNRLGVSRTYLNLMITMLLGGLWHGASWTFVAWGGLHGLALAVERFWSSRRHQSKSVRRPVRSAFSWISTFVFVLLTWVLFRSPDFETALTFLGKLAFLDPQGADWFYLQATGVIAVGGILHYLTWLNGERDLNLDLRRPIDVVGLVATGLILLFLAPLEHSPFIYFQF